MLAMPMSWGTLHVSADRREDAPGVAALFVNSLGTDLRMWDGALRHIDGIDLALRFDTRGHGLSTCSDASYSIADLAGDALAVLDRFSVEKAFVIGCSVGGLVAQMLALAAPDRVRALVLSNTAAKLGDRDAWEQRIADIRAKGMPAMASGILPRWFGPDFLNGESAALWRTMLARTDAEGYIELCRAIASADLSARTKDIAVPALAIGGTEDGATPIAQVEALARGIPNADFTIFENAGHLPAVEIPEAFGRAVSRFIERTTRD